VERDRQVLGSLVLDRLDVKSSRDCAQAKAARWQSHAIKQQAIERLQMRAVNLSHSVPCQSFQLALVLDDGSGEVSNCRSVILISGNGAAIDTSPCHRKNQSKLKALAGDRLIWNRFTARHLEALDGS